MEIPKLIQEIVSESIPVTLENFKDGKIGYNLNTEAKSDVILTLDDNSEDTFTAHMRYDDTDNNIKDLDDVIMTVKDAMHGRDFVSNNWLDLFIRLGYAETKTVTTTKIIF